MSETYEFNGKEYKEQEVKDTIKLIIDVFSEVINGVKNIIKETVRLINEYRERKAHDYNWNVPMDTTRLSQVRVPNVKLPRIRNLI